MRFSATKARVRERATNNVVSLAVRAGTSLDVKPSMIGVMSMTVRSNQKAKEIMNNPRPVVRRTTITRGIMEAVVYPNVGSLLIKTGGTSGIALTYEEAAALRDLLNAELPAVDPTKKDEEKINA
jgi:hypothetical protein